MPEQTQGMHAAPLPPELKLFEQEVGTWDAEVELKPPGAPVMRSRGFSVSRVIADGRWLITDFKNETTGFEGHGVYGWDPARKLYTGVWVDPMRSTLIVADGVWDEASRTLTYTSTAQLGGRSVSWRDLTETRDADTRMFRTLFPMPDGSQHEMMTTIYRRRK